MPTPTVVALIPGLINEEGHHFNYHLSVAKAAELLNWGHLSAVPRTCEIKKLPPQWLKCLVAPRGRTLFSRKLNGPLVCKAPIGFSRSLYRFFREKVIPLRCPIIFIETFQFWHLAVLATVLLFIPTERLSLWILHRHDHRSVRRLCHGLFLREFVIKGVALRLKQVLGKHQFRLLTDSQLLKNSLSVFFNQPVTVMPIPHTEVTAEESFPKRAGEIVAWWPGAARAEKGWNAIQHLANLSTPGASRIRLVAGVGSNLVSVPNGMRVQLTPDILTRSEYIKWLKTCDLILLPYRSKRYAASTSGIFVECIVAGKIPLVTQGTWMASELKAHHLDALIVEDWTNAALVTRLLKIATDAEVRRKIDMMQEAYKSYHNVKSYSVMMQSLWAQ